MKKAYYREQALERIARDVITAYDPNLYYGAPAMIPIPEPSLPAREAGGERSRATGAGGASGGNTTISITINELSLPGVTDKDTFLSSLQGLVAEMGA